MHVGWSWYLARSNPWSTTVAAIAMGAGLAAACTSLPGEDPERTARLERAEALVETRCASSEDCACTLTVAQAGCESTLNDTWRARLQAGEQRGLTFDDACMDAIEAGMEEARCGWPPADDRHPCHDFCQVYHGGRAEGQSCKRFDDLVSNCDQGLLCDRGVCTSPCTALSGLGEGEQCRDPVTSNDLDRCAQDLTCLFSTGRCARAPAVGEPCLDGVCDADGYCDWNEPNQRCQARVGEGANCDFAQCQQGLQCTYVEDANGYYSACRRRGQAGEPCFEVGCDDGLDCGPAGLCTPRGELGADCSYVGCIDGLLCNFDVLRCSEPPSAGSPCISGECERGAWCDTSLEVSMCVAGLPLATACTGHRQCGSGYCPAGFCAERPAIGESCAGSLVCEIGASCDGALCRPSVTHGPAVCVYEGW